MSKILLIDDEENARVLTAHFLELAGHEVVMAENGIKGLETADAETFDLIITDIIMPEKEGLETIIDLRKKMLTSPSLPFQAAASLPAKSCWKWPCQSAHLPRCANRSMESPCLKRSLEPCGIAREKLAERLAGRSWPSRARYPWRQAIDRPQTCRRQTSFL